MPVTPVAEAVHVSEHLAPPESPQPKQLHHLHTQPSLGQSYHWQILCLCIQDHSGHVQPFATLWTVACQASLPGGFSTQEYWSVLASTGCHSLLEHCISCCPSHQLPWVPVTARIPATQAAAPPPHLALTGADPCPPGQPQEQIQVDSPHEEVEMKPQLKLRGSVAKEEDLKPSHHPYKIKSTWSTRQMLWL